MRPRDSAPDALVVFAVRREDSRCSLCDDDSTSWYRLVPNARGGQDAVCTVCSGLDDLVLLPTGDARLTRRVKGRSTRSAALVSWARARKRYERDGWLVEEAAIEEALHELHAEGYDPGLRKTDGAWRFSPQLRAGQR